MLKLPVAIIGGGPVGLAAAAHLLERGESAVLFEAGATVGASVLDWAHVRMFSPWRYNLDAACVRLLEAAGWSAPPADELPTGAELYARYLQPLAELPRMRDIIHRQARVISISRRHHDKMKSRARADAPFTLRVAHADKSLSQFEARAVIDASGTWRNPNPAGADGLPALGEPQPITASSNGAFKAKGNAAACNSDGLWQSSGQARRITYGIPDALGRARALPRQTCHGSRQRAFRNQYLARFDALGASRAEDRNRLGAARRELAACLWRRRARRLAGAWATGHFD